MRSFFLSIAALAAALVASILPLLLCASAVAAIASNVSRPNPGWIFRKSNPASFWIVTILVVPGPVCGCQTTIW